MDAQAKQARRGSKDRMSPSPRRLAVVLSDPLKAYVAKGEVKPRYYNPGGLFKEVHFISFCDEDISVGSVQETVGSAQLAIHPVDFVGPWTFPARRNRVLRVLRAIQPDVIRSYNPLIAGWFAVQAGRALGCPVVLSLHNDFDHQRRVERSLKPHFGRFLERYTLSRATRVICVTRALVPYALRHGARNVEVIYNRVYREQFGRIRRDQVGAPRRILSVGRLVPQKDHACLLKAIVGLDVDLTIIGNGPLGPSLKALAAQLGVAERVRFIPAVPHQEIQKYYAEADLFAIATHYEGFCIPVLEAMATGLPVVASAVPAIQRFSMGPGTPWSTPRRGFGRLYGPS